MATRFEIELVDADDPEAMRRAIDAVTTYGETRYIRRGGSVVAVLQPPIAAPTSPPTTDSPEGRPFTFDDPLWQAVGIFAGDATDVSTNKKKYLAEAYAEEFE